MILSLGMGLHAANMSEARIAEMIASCGTAFLSRCDLVETKQFAKLIDPGLIASVKTVEHFAQVPNQFPRQAIP